MQLTIRRIIIDTIVLFFMLIFAFTSFSAKAATPIHAELEIFLPNLLVPYKPGPPLTAIFAGGDHMCAMTIAGAVKCWGDNRYGQLGDGTFIERHTPVDVVDLPSAIITIAAGGHHTCALTQAGGVLCWGDNSRGQLGTGLDYTELPNSPTPVNVVGLSSGVTAIAAGSQHNCAIMASGSVKCWGSNMEGQLGIGTFDNTQATPVDVPSLAEGVHAISLGANHSCVIVATQGVKCWGNNAYGEVGNGNSGFEERQLTPSDVVGLSSGVKEISVGGSHTCALMTSGRVKCWGSNFQGAIGDGSEMGEGEDRVVPVDVVGLALDIKTISISGHSCALTTSGSVKCWGHHRSYEPDDQDGLEGYSLVVINVYTLDSGIEAISAGGSHTCVLISGNAKCWGSNYYGQIGNDKGRDIAPFERIPRDVLWK